LPPQVSGLPCVDTVHNRDLCITACSVEKVGFNFLQMRPAMEKPKCWRS